MKITNKSPIQWLIIAASNCQAGFLKINRLNSCFFFKLHNYTNNLNFLSHVHPWNENVKKCNSIVDNYCEFSFFSDFYQIQINWHEFFGPSSEHAKGRGVRHMHMYMKTYIVFPSVSAQSIYVNFLRKQIGANRHPTSDIRHPTSDIRHPTSDDIRPDLFGGLGPFLRHMEKNVGWSVFFF